MPPETFEARTESFANDRARRLVFQANDQTLSYEEVLRRWRCDDGFCEFFGETLAAAPFEAFFWETPPIDRSSVTRPFECVLIEARSLAGMPPDPEPFREHLRARSQEEEIAVFWSLGGDALLLAPGLAGAPCAYAHLAAFLREAPETQKRELWRELGERVERQLDGRPLWVSTSGLGVAWLHLRIDRVPKYYQHASYRSPGRD